jgi:hypothetical protein
MPKTQNLASREFWWLSLSISSLDRVKFTLFLTLLLTTYEDYFTAALSSHLSIITLNECFLVVGNISQHAFMLMFCLVIMRKGRWVITILMQDPCLDRLLWLNQTAFHKSWCQHCCHPVSPRDWFVKVYISIKSEVLKKKLGKEKKRKIKGEKGRIELIQN